MGLLPHHRAQDLQIMQIMNRVNRTLRDGKGPEGNLQELIYLLEGVINQSRKLVRNAEQFNERKGSITFRKLQEMRNAIFSLIDTIQDFIGVGPGSKRYPPGATKVFRLLSHRLNGFYEENWFGQPNSGRWEANRKSTLDNDGILFWANNRKLHSHSTSIIRAWLGTFEPRFIVPLKAALQFDVPFGQMDAAFMRVENTDEAIQWIAAESSYLKRLRSAMKRIESTNELQKEVKAAKKADRLMRYLARSEKRSEHELFIVVHKLKRAVKYYPKLLELEREVKVSSDKLVRAFSFYDGDIRKELKRLKSDIAARQSELPRGRDKAIDAEIKRLAREIEDHLDELLKWIAGLQAALKHVESLSKK